MKILPKYITRQLSITLIFSLGVFTFVLLLVRMLRQLSEMLVNRHVGLDVIGWFILLLLPYILSFTLPMAMLAATLLEFGRLSADTELTAIRASGVGLGRVAAPVVVMALVLSGICFYVNATLAPQCGFQFRTLFLQLTTRNPMALLEEGKPIKDFPGYVVSIAHKQGNMIQDVALFTLNDKGDVISRLHAQTGQVTGKPAEGKLLLDLYKVTGDIRDEKDPNNVHKITPGTTADHYPVELDIRQAVRQARAARDLPDLMFGEVLDEIAKLRAKGIYPAAALMEAHQRVAGAVACVAFTLIGIPLGIKTSRRETSVGIALSLGLALIYYFTMVVANTLRGRPGLFPEAILWTPNFIFEILGIWLLWRVSRV